jgi:hypothetical protein
MGPGLPRAVLVAVLGALLISCAHTDFRIEETPWAWTPQFDCGATSAGYGCSSVPAAREPIHFAHSQSTVAAAVTPAPDSEPTVTQVERKGKKRRVEGRRRRPRAR